MRVPLPFPVTMEGRIDRCVLLSLRTPAEGVRRLVPRGLRLLVKEHARTGEVFAFWNIVLCHIDSMRPRGLPRWMGASYHHVAYRLMVESDDGAPAGGSRWQGLYFLRSDADSALVCGSGDLLSDFRFHRARIEREDRGGVESWMVRSRDGEGDASCEVEEGDRGPDAGSPFADAGEARRFLKYRPFGLAPSAGGRRLRLAEVFRDESRWEERPARVGAARWSFLDAIGEGHATIEVASRVAPIEYRWRLGRGVPVIAP